MSILRRVLFVAVVSLPSGEVASQDYALDPTFGEMTLAAGFTEDPIQIELASGGSIDASTLSKQCSGFIANEPDYRVHFTAGENSWLIISVVSEADTTLVVHGPDGEWYCNDDEEAEQTVNPAIELKGGYFDASRGAPASGQYDIWIGSKSEGAFNNATLFLSEVGSGTMFLRMIGG